jgi:acyl-CoA synthetase (AMP-forming)/AMP-acid ligase II
MPGRTTALGDRLGQVLALDPEAPAIEFQGTWRTWGQLAATTASVPGHVPGPGVRVGVMLRNHPAHVGILTGLLLARACVVMINPGRGEDRVRADVAALGLSILAGSPDDLARFAPGDGADGTAPLLSR